VNYMALPQPVKYEEIQKEALSERPPHAHHGTAQPSGSQPTVSRWMAGCVSCKRLTTDSSVMQSC